MPTDVDGQEIVLNAVYTHIIGGGKWVFSEIDTSSGVQITWHTLARPNFHPALWRCWKLYIKFPNSHDFAYFRRV